MQSPIDAITAGAGWDGWLLMCGSVVVFWALAVAGMVALFRTSVSDRHARPHGQPAAPPPAMSTGEVPADRYEQSGTRR